MGEHYNTVLTWQLIAYLAKQLDARINELPQEEYTSYLGDTDFGIGHASQSLDLLALTAEQRASQLANEVQG